MMSEEERLKGMDWNESGKGNLVSERWKHGVLLKNSVNKENDRQ